MRNSWPREGNCWKGDVRSLVRAAGLSPFEIGLALLRGDGAAGMMLHRSPARPAGGPGHGPWAPGSGGFAARAPRRPGRGRIPAFQAGNDCRPAPGEPAPARAA